MADTLASSTPLSTLEAKGIARAFRQWGGITFWIQLFVGVIPVVVITATFSAAYGVQTPIRSAGFLGLVSFVSFLILLTTTFWCWRYRRLGRRLADGTTTMSPKRLMRFVWIGLGLCCAGIVLSITVLFAEVAYLLIRFLEAPQAGVPVFQTVQGNATWTSAVDILGLMTVVLTLTGEIVVLVAGLWLLSRVMLLQRTPGSQ